MEEELRTVTEEAGKPPTLTLAPGANPAPLITIKVPPEVAPELGRVAVMAVTAGPIDSGRIVASFFKAPGADCRYNSGESTI
jgi:hypothetical protein